MGIILRKKLLLPKISSHNRVVFVECPGYDDCGDNSDNDPLLPPPPPDFVGDDGSKSNLLISTNLLLLICILGTFVILCFLIVFRKYRLNRRRTNSPNLDQANEEFINEDHGPELIHPIWLINTIGLQQSVIDSIEIFKYKKDQVLIEGTDCSVCLTEFQEDESLRLLPKCSHAFHIPCIDTWLRSHKNCPVCRAPIVVDTNNVDVSSVERNLNGLRSREDNLVGNLESNVELGSDQVGEDGENIMSARNFDVRVQSDLADHIVNVEGELQQRRRSISMDSSSASMIHFAAANIGDEAYLKKADSSKVGRKGYNRSSSGIFGVMKTSSFRRYLEKRPISMKRSFSSSGNWSKQSSSTSLPF